jgi:hypothetical protein
MMSNRNRNATADATVDAATDSALTSRDAALDALANDMITNTDLGNVEAQLEKAESPTPAVDPTPATTPAHTEPQRGRPKVDTSIRTAELHKQFDAVLVKMSTKSEKIRFLHTQGLSKGDISRVLDITFQHARAVVFAFEKKAADDAAKAANDAAKAEQVANS